MLDEAEMDSSEIFKLNDKEYKAKMLKQKAIEKAKA